MYCIISSSYFFFFNDTATTEIYTLSLHDALPILLVEVERRGVRLGADLQKGKMQLELLPFRGKRTEHQETLEGLPLGDGRAVVEDDRRDAIHRRLRVGHADLRGDAVQVGQIDGETLGL